MPEADMSMVEQTWRMIARSRRMIEASQALCIEETAHAAKCRHRLDASMGPAVARRWRAEGDPASWLITASISWIPTVTSSLDSTRAVQATRRPVWKRPVLPTGTPAWRSGRALGGSRPWRQRLEGCTDRQNGEMDVQTAASSGPKRSRVHPVGASFEPFQARHDHVSPERPAGHGDRPCAGPGLRRRSGVSARTPHPQRPSAPPRPCPPARPIPPAAASAG